MNLLGSTNQDQYQQPNNEVQHFSSQERCLSPPTITLMKMNSPTNEEGYDCDEIKRDENDCLEKFVENNQSQNQQRQ